MISLLIYSFQIFFIVLDCIVLLYLLRNLLAIFPFGGYMVKIIVTLVMPVWVPMQYLLRHSILHTLEFDLSPYLLLIILTYLQELCSWLLLHC